MNGSGLNVYCDLRDKKNTEEWINISRHNKYKYFVNAIDMAQNIKYLVTKFYLFFVNSNVSYEVNTLHCFSINISQRVKCVLFSLPTDIIHHTN